MRVFTENVGITLLKRITPEKNYGIERLIPLDCCFIIIGGNCLSPAPGITLRRDEFIYFSEME